MQILSASAYLQILGIKFVERLQNHSILEPFDASNYPGPLYFVDEWAKRHSMFEWYVIYLPSLLELILLHMHCVIVLRLSLLASDIAIGVQGSINRP